MNVEYKHLPHGRVGNVPDTIVIHCMAEYIIDPEPIHAYNFLDKYKLSAHALITPDDIVMVCRDDDEIAWHARGFNTNSLGVEFLVPGQHKYASFVEAIKKPYVSPQAWENGVECVRRWMSVYDIKKVVRHSDISPGRKVDPGAGFKWNKFLEEIYA